MDSGKMESLFAGLINKEKHEAEKMLSFDFLFYSPSQNEASNLAIALFEMGMKIIYSGFDDVFPEDNLWIVTGYTPNMKTDKDSIAELNRRLGKKAKENNCVFDGLGASLK